MCFHLFSSSCQHHGLSVDTRLSLQSPWRATCRRTPAGGAPVAADRLEIGDGNQSWLNCRVIPIPAQECRAACMRRREGRGRGASPTACPPSRSASAAPTRACSQKSNSHTMPHSPWLSTIIAILLFLSGVVAARVVTVDNAMQWRRAPGPPDRRFNQSLGAVGGKLYMFGDEDYTSLLSFDPQVLLLPFFFFFALKPIFE